MSNPQLEAFVMRIGQDAELRKKIETLQAKPPTEAIEELTVLSAEAGTPISAEEWAATFQLSARGGEITDADLDTLSGGWDLGSLFDFLTPKEGSVRAPLPRHR